MSSLAGKVTIVTGASSGIGAATAVQFARLGAVLAITGRNMENLEASFGPLEHEISGVLARLDQAQKKVSEEEKVIYGLEESAAGRLAI